MMKKVCDAANSRVKLVVPVTLSQAKPINASARAPMGDI